MNSGTHLAIDLVPWFLYVSGFIISLSLDSRRTEIGVPAWVANFYLATLIRLKSRIYIWVSCFFMTVRDGLENNPFFYRKCYFSIETKQQVKVEKQSVTWFRIFFPTVQDYSERNYIKRGPLYRLTWHLIISQKGIVSGSIRVRSCLLLFLPADEATGSRCWGNFSLLSFGFLSELSNKLLLADMAP